MKRKLSKHPWKLILLLVLCLGSVRFAHAQAGRQVIITEPDSSEFPRMTIYFDATERDGSEISDLTAEQLILQENGVEQVIVDFQGLTPGIQLVTAINISPPFAIQDIIGKSRFDYIKEGLLDWASQSITTSPDDLSLITNDGIELTHLSDRNQFITALEEYSPAIRDTESNFNVLARAIEVAADPVSQQGMKRVVLLISSQPSSEASAGLDSLLSLAIENQVQIYIILVSSPAFYNSASSSRLRNLSTETDGSFYPFSGENPFIDLETQLKPLRSTYLIEYDSQIITTGGQEISLLLHTNIGVSQGVSDFFLDVQPPNPIFISPPREIIRKAPEDEETDEELVYQPESITLDVLVDFPDQHPRNLEELIFRVDGEIIDRKISPPYDQFEWDLSRYQISGTHSLTLEAVDILGLSHVSLATPIEIKVDIPPPNLGTILSSNAIALGGLSLIFLTGLFLFVLISRGRIQPADPLKKKSIINRIKLFKGRSVIRKVLPVKTDQTSQKTENIDDNFIPYRLIPINNISQDQFTEPIRVTQGQITLGSNKKSNDVQIKHHSIARQHAKIDLSQKSRHQITDLGSSVGTWINYQQITSTKPQIIKDGDIINIGEAGFRFQIIPTRNTESASQEKNT